MLTQQRPVRSTIVTTVTLPQSPNLNVLLGGQNIGTIQSFLVRDLDNDDRATAAAMGLKGGDDCYLYAGQVYSNHSSATVQIVADYLAA